MPEFDPCIYQFWLQSSSESNIFVCPEVPVIGFDWDIGATVESSLPMPIPDNWQERKIVAVAINQGSECDQSGYLYSNWEAVERDILKGKIKGDSENLNFLSMLGITGEDPGTGTPGGSSDSNKEDGIPLWFWIFAGLITYNLVKK